MIQLPPSKSIGARYLVATYFAGTLPADPVFEENEDLMVLQRTLLEVFSDEEPIDYGDSPIDVGASGTSLRFVTAVCASCPGADYVITGTQRLMERPMLPLVNLLKEAGAGVEILGPDNQGPYRVTGNIIKGGSFEIPGDISSQFISAIMLVAPSWEKGVSLSFTTVPVSMPYLRMTKSVMEKFNIRVDLFDDEVVVPHAKYVDPGDFKVEADWSSAAFFYEACAISGNEVEIADLQSPMDSLQGDSHAAELFKDLGVDSQFNDSIAILTKKNKNWERVTKNFKDTPDLMLPYAVACLCTDTKFRFDGVAHLRLKESDRLEALKEEAGKLGYQIIIGDNHVEWKGEKTENEVEDSKESPLIDPHDDHRVAMAFAMAALKFGEIRIQHPEVVGKSFLDFWNQIPQLGLTCSLEGDIMIVKK